MTLLLALLFSSAGAGYSQEMVQVPEGVFIMGAEGTTEDERPRRNVNLAAFRIDRTEVTNEDFARFVSKTGAIEKQEGDWFRYFAQGCADVIDHYERLFDLTLRVFKDEGSYGADKDNQVAHWVAASEALAGMMEYDGLQRISSYVSQEGFRAAAQGQARLPVRGVTWRDAEAYCGYQGKQLPTEAQWEKAARGTEGSVYPWGSSWRADASRSGLAPEAGPLPVGSFPSGASPYGVLDLSGNVWEWTRDAYSGADGRMVLKGGAWAGAGSSLTMHNARAARRFWSRSSYAHPDVGFRCIREKR